MNSSTTFYILGASGFLGGACAEWLQERGYRVIRMRIDVSDFTALKRGFRLTHPDVVINFAGVRAYPNIDWCEDHKAETVKVNVGGAINAMLAAVECGAYPIQIASGCIYVGGPDKAFTEEDEPNFYGSFYSRCRIVMQNVLKELPVLQARIRMPISAHPHPRNLIDKIVSYKKVISVPNSITLTEDLWPALEKLAKSRPTGILNLVNDGYIEHGDILAAYQKIVDPKHTYEAISIQELCGPGGITKAQRSNCVMSNEKAKSLGIRMPELDKARLAALMRTYKQELRI